MNEFLEKEYRDNLTLDQGLKMVAQALANNIDNPKKNSSFAVVSRDGIKHLTDEELNVLFNSIEANE